MKYVFMSTKTDGQKWCENVSASGVPCIGRPNNRNDFKYFIPSSTIGAKASCYRVVRPAGRPSTPISHDTVSLHLYGFHWNLPQIFMCVGIVEKFFKVIGQRSRSWPHQLTYNGGVLHFDCVTSWFTCNMCQNLQLFYIERISGFIFIAWMNEYSSKVNVLSSRSERNIPLFGYSFKCLWKLRIMTLLEFFRHSLMSSFSSLFLSPCEEIRLG